MPSSATTALAPPEPAAAAAPAPPPRTHLAYLDGLRACAALYVVMHHAYLTVPALDSVPGVGSKLAKVLGYGHAAVDIFIVLSGFCLMLPVVRGDGTIRGGTLDFFKRRARRILPPYYFAMLFALALIATVVGRPDGTVWNNAVPVTSYDVVTHLLLIHDAFLNTFWNHDAYLKINYCFWSIAVEWRIYFAFPLLVLLWRRFGGVATTAAVTVFSYLLLFALRQTPINTHTGGVSPHFLGLFTMGMLGASIAFAKSGTSLERLRQRIPWGAAAAALAVVTALVSRLPLAHEDQTPACDLVVGLFTLALLVTASKSTTNPARRLLDWKPLAFVGTFSYSLYLLHAPLLEVLWHYVVTPLHLSPQKSFALLVSAGTAAIVGASYLFFLACERPFMTSAKKRSAALPVHPAPKAVVGETLPLP